jgi:hypothetical protein
VVEGHYAGRREEPWELSASRPATGEPRAPNGVAPGSGPGSGAGREFVDKHIKPMSEDLEKKRALFMDDASFISEVSSPLVSFSVFGSMPVCCQYSVLWGLR